MSGDPWWEKAAARRAAEPEVAGIRADSNDEVDAWEERETDLEPNMQGRASQKKPGGGPGMIPPLMGGMGGSPGGGATAVARPMGPAVTGPMVGDGGAMMQTAGLASTARSAGGAGTVGAGGGIAGLGAGSASPGGAGGLGVGGVGAAGAVGGPAGQAVAGLDGHGVPKHSAEGSGTGASGTGGSGSGGSDGTGGIGGSGTGEGAGSFTVDPNNLRVIASRWDEMSNRANQLSADSATARSDFALLRDADTSHHELTDKATNWSAGAGTEFRDLNHKLSSVADEYRAVEDSGVVQAGKVN